MYKPGQIITVSNDGQFRIKKAGVLHCLSCDARLFTCTKYCYTIPGNNDFYKYPNGYILKRIKSLCTDQVK